MDTAHVHGGYFIAIIVSTLSSQPVNFAYIIEEEQAIACDEVNKLIEKDKQEFTVPKEKCQL